MKKMVYAIGVVGVCLLMTGRAQADIVLISDDFSSNTVAANNRFRGNHIDSGIWNMRSTDGPSWAVSGGVLTNPGASIDDDKGLHLINSVSTTDSAVYVTVSFDYTVGMGTTLYFSSSLYTGASAQTGSGIIARNNLTGGEFYANDFNDNFGLEFNLKDGTVPSGTAGGSVASFVGGTSGTFSQTFDISGYGSINSIADISHILAVFTADTSAAGNGAISIDNFKVEATAVPEPASLAILLGGLGLLTLRRRRV